MSKWVDQTFDFSAGMSTNKVNPGPSFGKRILNVHNHVRPGALVLRPGYSLKYAKPECLILDNMGNPIITDFGFINYDFFFDRQAVTSGQEITCQIQKAQVHGLNDDNEIQDVLCFYIRPYWDGLVWVDEWQWLNETIITKIVNVDSTYPNTITITGNIDNGITDNSLDKFTIYNKTKDEYAKIITSKVDSGTTRICHTLYNNTWAADDVVVIMKNFIDLNYLTELFKVNWEDIAFHKILNDLRIGFGGQENRPGLSVGYRKKFFQIRSFDFPNKHADITESGVLEDFSKIDEVVLDTHILNNNYGLSLTAVAGGALAAGEYGVRLTGIIDGFEEQLLVEKTILVPNNESTIEILPYVNMGQINPRITGFGIYFSTDEITYYKIFKYNLKEDLYAIGSWKINSDGKLILIKTLDSSESEVFELHTESNAVSILNDTNTAGSWTTLNGGTLEVATDAVDSYALKYTFDVLTTPDSDVRFGIIYPL